MEIITRLEPGAPLTYQDAKSRKTEGTWKQLGSVTVAQAAQAWIATLQNPHTARAYQSGLKVLAATGLLNPSQTLQAFALVNHEAVLDSIKGTDWSEATRQARSALYCAFTGFLERQTQGLIRKAIPSRSGTTKTFFKVREKVSTPAMSREETKRFLQELKHLNPRDRLIACLILQGAKRRSEVLQVSTKDIDWKNNQITFKVSKTKGYEKSTVITYPCSVLEALKAYIGYRDGLVFVTSKGKAVQPTQIDRTFRKAGELADIGFPVSAHVLRATAITLWTSAALSDGEIMKATGHASSEMVRSYDKSELGENASAKVILV